MNEFNSRIGEQMKELVQAHFTAAPLARYALSFVEEKLQESIKFGQLTVIHYYLFEGKKEDEAVVKAAAAVELIILASDMLDDLQDQDAPEKLWMKAPQAAAIHVATSLLTLAQQAMLDCTEDQGKRLALAALLNRQLLAAANGQMIDLMNEVADEQAYVDMVKRKSASLLVLACMSGVILAGLPWHSTVEEYATELGVSAQIRNDIRDLLRWDDKSDFLQRKKSLLTLFLLEGAGDEESWIVDYFEGRLSSAEVLDKQPLFEEICEQSGALLYGSVMSRMHYNQFEELLASLQAPNDWKERLLIALNH